MCFKEWKEGGGEKDGPRFVELKEGARGCRFQEKQGGGFLKSHNKGGPQGGARQEAQLTEEKSHCAGNISVLGSREKRKKIPVETALLKFPAPGPACGTER